MNIKIIGPWSLAWGDNADAAIQKLMMTAGISSTCRVDPDISEDTVAVEVPRSGISDEQLQYVQDLGYVVSGLPVWIRMSAETYSGEVPAGLPNRDIVDDEGSATGVRAWSQWHDATHSHRQLSDGDWIVPGNSWGRALTLDELEPLRINSAYMLLATQAVRAVYAAEPQPEF